MGMRVGDKRGVVRDESTAVVLCIVGVGEQPHACDAGDVIIRIRRCNTACLLYTSPSPRDLSTSRMPSSA